jgi:hypothetical protein
MGSYTPKPPKKCLFFFKEKENKKPQNKNTTSGPAGKSRQIASIAQEVRNA